MSARRSQPHATVPGAIFHGAWMGTLGGGLAGSFVKNTDGQSEWKKGAAGGGAALGAFATIVNAPAVPVVVGTALSAGGGAVAGYNYAEYQKGQGKEEDTKKATAIGAAAAGGGFFLAKMAGGSSKQWVPRFLGPRGSVHVLLSGRVFRLVARW